MAGVDHATGIPHGHDQNQSMHPRDQQPHTSEDENSGSSGPGRGKKRGKIEGKPGGPPVGQEGTGGRKPRGRPPGSKNKPKPPIYITRDTGSGMRPHVLEAAGPVLVIAASFQGATFDRLPLPDEGDDGQGHPQITQGSEYGGALYSVNPQMGVSACQLTSSDVNVMSWATAPRPPPY
ncbi:hypothetical protein AXG93_4201s1280 [Marchantia polymorpha subsp. ruderalis]|uniref:AT-hook motif nuclear-localized protein n=1 Tax=Marchantia polymorpha subsp. ruderalis TaxID=1480154 RepID=A0A176WB08_MARPO|nr:hypothetical protein AXG93_4201s1280 [Marchantia polymorpha subsp. ruderalis]